MQYMTRVTLVPIWECFLFVAWCLRWQIAGFCVDVLTATFRRVQKGHDI